MPLLESNPPHRPTDFTPWDAANAPDGTPVPFSRDDLPVAPPVRVYAGEAGRTQVDTAALRAFATNTRTLLESVRNAHTALNPVTLAPGGFYVAKLMRDQVTGTVEGAGLKPAFLKVLTDLQYGLDKLASGMDALAKLYDDTEDDNRIDAARLAEVLDTAPGYFNRSVQDTSAVAT
ncbi:hypothetical protein [Streptomyces sp. NPDC096068]|uniref:hypothetical protein n=1 Tax=Streptomyces sp. NPDC096068 TaxID=3155424 RepID=UPI00331C9691